MDYKILKKEYHLDDPEGFRCRFITSDTEREVLHAHEFYEIFLTLTDNVKHTINGTTEMLKKGSLVFVRPDDIHYYSHDLEPYNFINLAFSTEIADALFSFLGDDFPFRQFIIAELSPTVLLSANECRSLKELLQKIISLTWNNSAKKSLFCKMILTTIFTEYFIHYKPCTGSEIPAWLSETCRLMHNKENFLGGIPTMVRLSGKTYEHLSRTLKQYYDKTVTKYINDIRLNYAANLITYTNLSITEIYLECGYNNPGWFFTCFKKKFGISPNQFRLKKG